jgi:hypothetical protein
LQPFLQKASQLGDGAKFPLRKGSTGGYIGLGTQQPPLSSFIKGESNIETGKVRCNIINSSTAQRLICPYTLWFAFPAGMNQAAAFFCCKAGLRLAIMYS